jgi:hypothetical protein
MCKKRAESVIFVTPSAVIYLIVTVDLALVDFAERTTLQRHSLPHELIKLRSSIGLVKLMTRSTSSLREVSY